MMSPRASALLAALGCAALLAAALGFQHLGGLTPCEMCVWQRWPHVIGAAAGLALLLGAPRRLAAGLGLVAMLIGAGLAALHVGVEQHWWRGPTACSGGGDIDALSTDALLEQIMTAPLVRCDEIAWSLLGVSMAGWNALACLALTGLFAHGLSRRLAR